MTKQPAAPSSIEPLGTGRDLRRRFLLHHLPLAVASAAVLVIFMDFPLGRHVDIFSGAFPRGRGEGGMDHGAGQAMDHGGQVAPADRGAGRTMDHSGGQTGARQHGEQGGEAGHGARTGRPRRSEEQTGPMGHGRGQGGSMGHGGDQAAPPDQGGAQAGSMEHGGAQAGATDHGGGQNRSFIRQFTVASGYVALGLLAITLLIGPANLLLHRRTPISNYLARDVGMWAAIGSVIHTVFALQVHGSGRIRDFLAFFVTPDGSPLLNSFGLGNWTGLAALVIVTGLFAISSDVALRQLKARPWKRLQRLNYALFALVILHAYFYGALLRLASPFTLLLGVSVIAVFAGQAIGIRLWRRRHLAATTQRDPESVNS